MTEERFTPYKLSRNKTVKEWKEWLSNFNNTSEVFITLVEGDSHRTNMDAWTSNKRLYFEVKE